MVLLLHILLSYLMLRHFFVAPLFGCSTFFVVPLDIAFFTAIDFHHLFLVTICTGNFSKKSSSHQLPANMPQNQNKSANSVYDTESKTHKYVYSTVNFRKIKYKILKITSEIQKLYIFDVRQHIENRIFRCFRFTIRNLGNFYFPIFRLFIYNGATLLGWLYFRFSKHSIMASFSLDLNYFLISFRTYRYFTAFTHFILTY